MIFQLDDYGLRISLAKEIKGQMLIVTQLPDISAQSRAFISGRSKGTWHGDLYTQIGGGDGGKSLGGKRMWARIQVAVWACVYKPTLSLGLNI